MFIKIVSIKISNDYISIIYVCNRTYYYNTFMMDTCFIIENIPIIIILIIAVTMTFLLIYKIPNYI